MIVRAPRSTSQSFAGWKLKQDGVDHPVLIAGRAVRQALQKMFCTVGQQQMIGIDKVDGQHGAARQHELHLGILKAERFKR